MVTSSRTLARRHLLALGGAASLAGVVGLQSTRLAHAQEGDSLFTLGVASGDPMPDGVVLWTRLATDPTAPDGSGGMARRNIPVSWQVAEDERFRKIVKSGVERATPAWAHSVHAEVDGLRPDREYWYRFRVGRDYSPVGRTRTAPARDAHLSSLSFVFASCQNYKEGYFTAYREMARDDLDLIVHLGDYIYETGGQGDIGRGHLPDAEVFSLADYRVRYGQYKTDPDLQAAHAAAPWVVAPDDHDVENNWAGDHSQPDDEPDQDPAVFRQRRAAAYQAYYENLPLRRSSMPDGPEMQVYRRLTFGDLAEFNVLDTRRYRDVLLTCTAGECPDRWNSSRTMLGAEQERWLKQGLSSSEATWNILGNQVFSFEADHTAGPDVRYGMDTWDGYASARQRLFDFVEQRSIDNFVMITGDAHRSVAADLKIDFLDPDSATVGTEFLGTSISAGGDGVDQDELGKIWLNENPHMKFHNQQRGYQRCTITPEQWETEYRVVPTVLQPGSDVFTRATVTAESGRPGVAEVLSRD